MLRNKTIKFDMGKPEDRELWEWLRTVPHGYFSEEVKAHFSALMVRQKDPMAGVFHQQFKDKGERK